ncbi:MAG: hypothetical protein ACKO5C_05655, partial [Ferruginibacter sp.]
MRHNRTYGTYLIRRGLGSLLFLLLFSGILSAQSITIINFENTATYAPGSTVSVHVYTGGYYPKTNVFDLLLSDASGSFVSPTLIGSRSDFYTPIIVGLIPAGTPAGTGYKLRIRSTLISGTPGPVVDTDPFTIQAGVAPHTGAAGLSINITGGNSNIPGATKINCLGSDQYSFGYLDRSSNSVTPAVNNPYRFEINNFNSTANEYTAELYRRIGQTTFQVIPLTITTGGVVAITSNLPVGYYPIKIKARNKTTSIVSIQSFIFLFNTGNTGLANLSSENICVGTAVDFVADSASMSKNYPASQYTLSFDECLPDSICTFYQIYNNPQIQKVYTLATCENSTCAVANPSDPVPTNRYYAVTLNLFYKGVGTSPNCSQFTKWGNGATKYVNASKPPIANFTASQRICRGSAITATNTSTGGFYGFGSTCSRNFQTTWSVKRPGDLFFTTVSDPTNQVFGYPNLNYPGTNINVAGCWEVMLEVKNPSGCELISSVTKIINVEAPLTADFSIAPTTPICYNQTVSLTDLSSGVTPCSSATFSWTVSPATGWTFTGGTSSTSQNPQLIFTVAGTYTITQSVTNICGTYTKSRTITVNGDPTVTGPAGPFIFCEFPPAPVSVIVDFSNPTYTPTYSTPPRAPASYSWTVDGPATDFEFLTASNVPYPIIKFKEFRTYNVTVTANGNCGVSSTKTYVIHVRPKPTITNTSLNQVICSGTSTTPTTLTSDLAGTTYTWSATSNPTNGLSPSTTSGSTNPIPAILLTNVTPNAPATFTYSITPVLNGCNGNPQSMVITVNPTATVSAITNQVVCNGGNTTAVTFGSPTTGGTIVYNWTNNTTS